MAGEQGDARPRDHTTLPIVNPKELKVQDNIQLNLSNINKELAGVGSELTNIHKSHLSMKMGEGRLGKFEQVSKINPFVDLLEDKFPSIHNKLESMIGELQASQKKVNEKSNSTKFQWNAYNLSCSIVEILVYCILAFLLSRRIIVIGFMAYIIKVIVNVLQERMKFYFDKREKEFEDEKRAGKIMHENIILWLDKSNKMISLSKELRNHYWRFNEDVKLMLDSKDNVKTELLMKKVKKKYEVIESGIDCLKDKVDASIANINLAMSSL